MVFRKRTRKGTRRKSTRRRRYTRRSAPKSLKALRSVTNKHHYFERWATSSDMTLFNTTASVGATCAWNNSGLFTLTTNTVQSLNYFGVGLAFCMDDVANETEFTQLFQFYKLMKIMVRLIPMNTVSATALPGTVSNGGLGGIVHYSPFYQNYQAPLAGPAGSTAMRQLSGYRVANMINSSGIGHEFVITPRVLAPTYQAGINYGYRTAMRQWVSTLNTSVQHFGCQLLFETVNPTSDLHYFNYKVEVQYLFEFKDTQ